MKKPLVGGIVGRAIGGGFELSLLCDLLVAGQTASFSLPELRLGLIPGCGGSVRLTRLIGRSRASHHLLTGSAISADEAAQLRLVVAVLPDEQVVGEAVRLAKQIAALPSDAVAAAKAVISAADDQEGLQAALQTERRLFLQLLHARTGGSATEPTAKARL